jgi:D-alanyl-lipoteichoic acid acyltransferase DltB (MBOAT superfamily)
MIFNSWEFVILFVLTLGSIYILKPQIRKYILLLASSIFIGFYHAGFLAMAVITALLTYSSAIWIDSKEDEDKRSFAFKTSLVIHLLILVGFKYFGFLENNIGKIVQLFGGEWNSNTSTSIFVPLGISFYIFQSISYLTEVYWEEQESERNVWDFLLYMLFFMKFLSGPIERAESFLPQIKKPKAFNYEQATYGLQLIYLGLFKKLIIADRLAPALNDVFNSVHDFSGAQFLISGLLYPIQLYADFSGYTDIAIGGAAILGYRLSPNFNRPFTADSITEFWRRWHMSLSFWVKDYLYEPIAMNKRRWGIWGIVYALFVTFVLLGLWHGGSWNFVIYGAIQGLVISYEMICGKWRKSLLDKLPNSISKIYGIIRTYLIFSFSLLFFKLEKLSDVAYIISHLGDGIKDSFKELNLGLRDHDIIVSLAAIALLFLFEYFNQKRDLLASLTQQKVRFRWTIYYFLLFLLITQGVFGASDFIYIQF